MSTLANFVYVEIWVLLIAYVLVVFYKLLSGGVNTRGMLLDKETGKPDSGRMQLLLLTFGAALTYAMQISGALGAATPAMPAPSESVLWIVGASNGIYLGNKAKVFSFLFQRGNSEP